MEPNDLDNAKTKYQPVIQEIIDRNKPFYQFASEVHWSFYQDDIIARVAFCDKGFNIRVNILSVLKAYEEFNQPLMIEYFILHEIRHFYQRLCVQALNNNSLPESSKQKAEQWSEEWNHYIAPTDDAEGYYLQSIEFDAFSFSYAVMTYKYGKVGYITPPEFLLENTPFIDVVQKWLKHFADNHYPKGEQNT